MSSILTEYGLVLVVILLFGVGMMFVQNLMSKDGLRFTFKTHSLYGQYKQYDIKTGVEFSFEGFNGVVTLDDINGVANVADIYNSPYFVADGDVFKEIDKSNLSVLNNLNEDKETSSWFTYDENTSKIEVTYSDLKQVILDSGLKAERKGHPVALNPDKLHVVIVEYTPVVGTYTQNGVVKNTGVTALLDATDSFGNRILDGADGKFKKTRQVIYNETIYSESGEYGGDLGEGTQSEITMTNKADVTSENYYPYEIVEAADYDDLTVTVRRDYKSFDKGEKFVIDQDTAKKYKFIVRYDDETATADGAGLKCEFTVLFKNKVRSEHLQYYKEEKT